MMSGSVSINYGHELAQDLGLIDSGRRDIHHGRLLMQAEPRLGLNLLISTIAKFCFPNVTLA
jgi:hypothetical protein